MEQTMSEQDAAAQAALDNAAQAARTEERTRVSEIRALCREHAVPQDQIDKWLDDGAITVAAVKDQILDRIKAGAERAPVVRARVGAPRADADPRRGFTSPRDFLHAVMTNKGRSMDTVKDERLRPLLAGADDEDGGGDAPAFFLPRGFNPKRILDTVGSDEQGGYAEQYGGALVPETQSPGLLRLGPEADPTMGRVQAVPMMSPVVKIPARVDKDHSTSVSGGLTFTRTPETYAATASRMEFEKVALEASPLVGLAYATEQIMTDSPISFAAILASGFSDQRGYHILNEKLNGLGGSQYVGVINADCTVSVAKETNQAADSIVGNNIIKMASRVWNLDQAIWLANHGCRPQLATCSINIGTAGVLLYHPAEREGFPDMLWGRPVFYTEHCSAVGDLGDIVLGNWGEYMEGVYQPMRQDESIHVRFVNLERAFRFYERTAGLRGGGPPSPRRTARRARRSSPSTPARKRPDDRRYDRWPTHGSGSATVS
jgi:HK97 family phage major capsid protein